MTAGAPGGSRISTAVLQVILNVIDFGMNVQDAVDAPRVHHQWQPDKLSLERGISPDTVALLKSRGLRRGLLGGRRAGAGGGDRQRRRMAARRIGRPIDCRQGAGYWIAARARQPLPRRALRDGVDASARAVGTYVRAARTDAAATNATRLSPRPCDGDGR
jgi:hypothetical protein